MSARARTVLLCTLSLIGCGYFNSLYNANKRLADAQRAEERRDAGAAAAAYREALDKAAASYRKDSDGRWSDDALLIVGRARYGLREYPEARAALLRVIEATRDDGLRAEALAFLGAAELGLGQPAEAIAALDRALQVSDQARFRLWRARAYFALGDVARGWTDLERAAAQRGATGTSARLEALTVALDAADTARFRASLKQVLDDGAAAAAGDSVRVLLNTAALRWGASFAQAALVPARSARWPGEARDKLLLQRAILLAQSGDTAGATAEARAAARSRGPAADSARTIAARLLLAGARRPEDLAPARALLADALTSLDAHALLRAMSTLQTLLGYARERGQALAVFAAAEIARDELGALALARELFVTYAAAAPSDVWAPKALLAAAALGGGDSLERLAGNHFAAGNPYIDAVRGHANENAFQDAETRLAQQILALRSTAMRQAEQRDRSTVLANAAADNVRDIARADSLRIRCGTLVDSLVLTGIRADSVRGACLRGDTALVAWTLNIDTLILKDSVAARAARKKAGIDTTRTSLR